MSVFVKNYTSSFPGNGSRIRVRVTRLVLIIVLANLGSCASTQQQADTLKIAGLEFRISGDLELTNVELTVANNAGFISCGQVLPGSSCSTTFPIREYSGQELTIEWRYRDQLYIREGVVLDLDESDDNNQPVNILVLLRQSELFDVGIIREY